MEKQIQTYLHKNIPISEAMGIKVEEASLNKVILSAPFKKNINHKHTVFGGSLHAVATLTCWSLLYLNFNNYKPIPELVITHSEIFFLTPIDKNFCAICTLPDSQTWQRFIKIFDKKHKARIELDAHIFQNEKIAVNYQGTFAALQS